MEHLSSGRSNGAPGSADLLQKPSAVGMAALMSREMRKKSHIPKKTVIVYAPHINETFEVALFSGSSDQALHRSCATRARVAPFLQDGRDTFYFTSGAATDAIVPLCEGLPDGVRLTMHVTAHSAAGNSSRPSGAPAPPPPAASAPAAPPAAPPTQAEQEDAAAKKLQAIQRGHMSRKQGVPLYDEATRYLRRTCGVCMPWVSNGEQYEKVKEHKADNEEDEVVRGMAKMSRLATDMANERTLLAWIRTVLAVMRTVFSTLGMAGVGATWVVVQRSAVGLMVFLMLASTFIGIYRYHKVARIVNLKTVPTYFGRASIVPLNVGVAISVTTVAVAAMLQGFE